MHVGRCRKLGRIGNQLTYRIHVRSLALCNQVPQRIVHSVLAFAGRNFQDLHVLFVCLTLGMAITQGVISDAELARRKHLFAILVIGERPRLTDQRIDEMAIIDRHTVLAHQSRHRLHGVALVGDCDLLGAHAYIDALPNQTTRNRIRVGSHVDRATFADSNASQNVIRVQTRLGESRERRLLFLKATGAIAVALGYQRLQELDVLLP